jgi:universal stress protein A
MFQQILVPTDLTERAEKALDLALTLSAPGKSRVILLHVIETFHGLEFEEMKPFYQKFEKKAEQKMTAAAKARASDTRTEIVQEIVYGDRAEEIVRSASAHAVDLIVLASHRVNPSAESRDWGTISYKVGILAQCPVLLVK